MITAEGVLTDSEILSSAVALNEDPRYDPNYDEICELNSVTEFIMTNQGIC